MCLNIPTNLNKIMTVEKKKPKIYTPKPTHYYLQYNILNVLEGGG